jgi:hypothetical protein
MKSECGKTARSVCAADGGKPFSGRLLRPDSNKAGGIGGNKRLSFCAAPASFGPTISRKVRRLRCHRLTVKHRTITRQFNLQSSDNTNAPVNKQAQRRFAVEKVQRLRAMGSLCRQQAAYNSMNKWKLLAEAEYWDHLADLALSSHFQQCNAITNTNDAERKTTSA